MKVNMHEMKLILQMKPEYDIHCAALINCNQTVILKMYC
jgi:hypothetical protein